MGAVYRGVQHSFSRDVAIKVMNATASANPEMIKRFLREAKLASRLAHPNAVAVLDCGETDDSVFYLVMELITGRTLADAIAEDTKFTPARVVRIGVQVCEALESAHALSIVHRDLKPTNIMVLSHGRDVVKVLDFGLAKSLAPETARTMTGIGTMLGTPAFMPPELATGQPCDGRADLYSLGVILFLLGTGQLPFESESVNELIAMHGADRAPPMTGVPAELAKIVDRLLAKSPDDRFQTATETREALEQFLERGRSDAAVSRTSAEIESATTARRTAQVPVQRSVWLSIGLAIALLGVVGIVLALAVAGLPDELFLASVATTGAGVLVALAARARRPAERLVLAPARVEPVPAPVAAEPVPITKPLPPPPRPAPSPLVTPPPPAPAPPPPAPPPPAPPPVEVLRTSGLATADTAAIATVALPTEPLPPRAAEPDGESSSTDIAIIVSTPSADVAPSELRASPTPATDDDDDRATIPKTMVGPAPVRPPGPRLRDAPTPQPRSPEPAPEPPPKSVAPSPAAALPPAVATPTPGTGLPKAPTPMPASKSLTTTVPGPAKAPTPAPAKAALLAAGLPKPPPPPERTPKPTMPAAGLPPPPRPVAPKPAPPPPEADPEPSVIVLGPPGAPEKPKPAVASPASSMDFGAEDPLRASDTLRPGNTSDTLPPDNEGEAKTQVVPPPITPDRPETDSTQPIVPRTATGELDDLPGEPTRVTPMDLPFEPTAVTPPAAGDTTSITAVRPIPEPAPPRPTPLPPLPPGARRLGRYVAEGPIARGPSGPVFKSRDEVNKRDVHIETMPDSLDLVAGTAMVASVAKVEHANLVRVYELIVHAGKPYLVREPLGGRPLDQHVKERGGLPWLEALGLVDEVCAGLERLHERSIVHRAVRAACVVVDGKTIKLGGVAITPDFLDRAGLAPEVIAGAKPDRRSDIYGVGATLFQCLTNRPPKIGDEGGLDKVPANLAGLVFAMLAKDPAARPGSVLALRATFKDLIAV